MDDCDDLLLTGGFAPHDLLLQGLTLEQVSTCLPNVPHSIYQDLWHAANALHLGLEHGRWPWNTGLTLSTYRRTLLHPVKKPGMNSWKAFFLTCSVL